MIKTLGERDYSAQEVMTIIFGWDLYNSTRSFVFLCINDDDWMNVEVDQNDGSIKMGKNLLQKYKDRPNGPFWNDMTLFHFAKNHYTVKRKGKVSYATRRKEAIVRIFPKLKLTGVSEKDEDFYRLEVILNKPFNKDIKSFDDLLYDESEDVQHESWETVYNILPIRTENEYELPDAPEEEGEEFQVISEEEQRDPAMTAARMVNNIAFEAHDETLNDNLGKCNLK